MCSNKNDKSKFKHFFKATWYKKTILHFFLISYKKTNEYAKKSCNQLLSIFKSLIERNYVIAHRWINVKSCSFLAPAEDRHTQDKGAAQVLMLEFCFYCYEGLLHCICIVSLYVCHLPFCQNTRALFFLRGDKVQWIKHILNVLKKKPKTCRSVCVFVAVVFYIRTI